MFNKKQSTDRDYTGYSTSTPPSYSPEPSPTATPQGEAATSPASPAVGTFLAEGATFDGKANVTGTMRIEGKADGELEATESIVVGKTGTVHANLKTRRAVLNGRFDGKIDAEDRVELQAGSRVEAEIRAKNMVMEDGVHYTGNCQIGQ
jgi:cytoskeletal protein CcmA (bactofilin family)